MSARNLTQLSDDTRLLLMDADGLTIVGQIDSAVLRGVTRLSQFRPRVRIHEITGDGTAFRFNAPSDWQGGFSAVKKVLYPVDVTIQSLPPELKTGDVQIMLQPDDTYKIHFSSTVPVNAKVAHIYYLVEHSVDTSTSTIKSKGDEDAVVYWSAAELLRIMAAKVNASKNIEELSGIGNRESRGSQYITLAKLYEERSGLLEGAALGWGPIDPGTQSTQNHLTH